MLLDYGLLEDWDPRLLDEWGETGEASSFAGSGTLRQLRRTGRLGELNETAQSTLLGSTLFQYSGDALPSRAPAPRAMQSTMGSSAGFGGTQAYMTLRRRVEQLLRDSSFGGTTGRDGDFSQSLTSTMLGGLRGVGASAPDFSSTMGVLEGHLSPLEETLASSRGFDASQPFETGFRETARSGFGSTGASGVSGASSERLESRGSEGSSFGETRDSFAGSDGFLPTRNPALATTDSWALGDSRGFATGRSALGSLAEMGEEDRTDMLVRLINSASFGDFDESLVRSVQRVLQLGSLLAGERLSKVEVDNLPKVHFEQQEEQQCSICLEAFRHGELLTQLPCGHFFRVDCIARWFQNSSQCPLCRSECA